MKNKILLFCTLLVLVFGCKNPSEEKEFKVFDLAILNAQHIDLETGDIRTQNIFISEKRIEVTAPVDSIFSYKAENTIDVSGSYVLPGFWDNHVHFRGGDSLIEANKGFLELFLDNGVTTVRDAGGDLTSAVMNWKAQIEDGTLEGPTIFSAGPKIDGANASWAGSIEVTSKEEVTKALDSLESLKVDFVKLYDSRISGELYLESIREAEKRGFVTSGHMPFSVTLEETVNAGLDGVEHMYYVMKGASSKEREITDRVKSGDLGFWDSMSQLLDSQDDATKTKTFQLLKDRGVYVIPTLHIGDVLTAIPDTDHSQDDYLKRMSDGIIATYQGRIRGAMNASEEMKANRRAMEILFEKLVKELNDNDVKLLAGSDCGAFNSYVYPGISIHRELQAFVGAGLSPLEALRTSAYNGANFLSQENDYGAIAKGKMADIVILRENPLEDITNSQKISFVIKAGKILRASKE